MKIGVNALFLIPGEVGGAERYARRTLDAMAQEFPRCEFTVFVASEGRPVLARDLGHYGNVCLVDMKLRARNRCSRILREQLALPRLVAATDIDVLWSPGYTVPLRCPCPRLTSILDMQYKTHPEDFGCVARWATRLLVGAAARCSERIVTISEFSRQEIIKHARVPYGRIDVAYLAADQRFSDRLPGALIAERTLALTRSADPFLLAVSNTYPHKNMDLPIKAFGRIMDRIPHRLVLVGQPCRGEPAVEAAIANTPHEGRIVRINYVDDHDLVALYQAADALLFPSRYEGFGLPVLEAFAAGTPVIAVRAGSVPEIGGEAAVYVSPGNDEAMSHEILQLLDRDPDTRAQWRKRGQDRAAQFSWVQTARRTVRACRLAVSESLASPSA